MNDWVVVVVVVVVMSCFYTIVLEYTYGKWNTTSNYMNIICAIQCHIGLHSTERTSHEMPQRLACGVNLVLRRRYALDIIYCVDQRAKYEWLCVFLVAGSGLVVLIDRKCLHPCVCVYGASHQANCGRSTTTIC